jgi:hypothetical protein
MKKLSKCDYTFNKNVKSDIESQSRENEHSWFSSHQPIFIPKRKKFRK